MRLVNPQSGARLEQLAGLLPDGPRWFAELAAMIETVDLVVTCDTVVAHVAGALGRPAWWRCGRWPNGAGAGDTTPRYPTLRLFRQPAPGDRVGVFTAMLAALREGKATAPLDRRAGG